MSTNERDTHFAEYAHLHCEEVSQLFFALYARIAELRPFEEIDALEREIETLMARRAYDLVEHTLKEVNYYMLNGNNPFEWAINSVPDMTSFPEQASRQSP